MSRDDAPEVTDAIRVYVADMKHWSDSLLMLVGVALLRHEERGLPAEGLSGRDCTLLAEHTMWEAARRMSSRFFLPTPPS